MWKKRVAALFLACAMLFSMLPLPAQAEDDTLLYRSSSGAYTLTRTSDGQCRLCVLNPVVASALTGDATLALYQDQVTEAFLGAGVTVIVAPPANPFSMFPNLKAIDVDDANTRYVDIDGVLFMVLNDGATQLLSYPPAKTTAFTLPESLIRIGSDAFSGVSSASIYIPNGLTLESDSPISLETLQSKYHAEFESVPEVSVESVSVLFGGAPVSSTLECDPDDELLLSAAVTPSDAPGGVTWSSSDESVATVSAAGAVSAVGGGEAVITATTVGLKGLEHLFDSCTVQVRPRVEQISVTSVDGRAMLAPNESMALSAAVSPEGANQNLVWSVSDSSILSLSADTGSAVTVTAQAPGSATVTAASARYGTVAGVYEITVSVPVTGVALNTNTLSLNLTGDVGESAQLTATVEPMNATNKSVTWTSSDESVATVDADGRVTAVSKGSAVITVTTADSGRTAECAVTVVALVVDIVIDPPTLRVEENRTAPLSATVSPEYADDPSVTWSSGNSSIATVDENGVVTGVSRGSTTIIATANDAGQKTVVCNVEVIPVQVRALTLSAETLTVGVRESEQLEVSAVNPADADDQTVVWSSSDESVATVDQNGVVTGVAMGTATVTVTANGGSGVAAACEVTVPEAAVTALAVEPATLTLRVDPALPTAKYGQLSVSFEPDYATCQEVTWVSLKPEVASVDVTGKVTALSGGEAVILATSTHGAGGTPVTAQCTVAVEMGARSVSIDDALALSLHKDGEPFSATLTAAVEPATSTDAPVWFSSNESVATVENGVVTANSEGVATVTVTCGSASATCTVTVTDYQVKKFDALPQNVSVRIGETETVSAKLGPSHATDKAVVWSIDNDQIASLGDTELGSDGVSTVSVTGRKVGTATVTARSADNGAVVAACTVTVPEIKAATLRLDRTELTLYHNTPDGKESELPPSASLTLTISPANNTNDVVWTSSDDSVVTLTAARPTNANNVKTQTVTLSAVEGGTAVITAAADGQTAQCTVTVAVLATGISLNKSTLELVKGTGATLIPSVLPANTANPAVTWMSSNAQVASVDANGVVTAVAASGTATITATAKDGSGVKATCTVTAKPVAATGITLNSDRVTLEKGDSTQLSATVTPSTVTDGSVTWTSADDTVATVDATGKVTAVSGGSTTVTAATADGKFTAACEVTVTVALTGLALDHSTLTIRRAADSPNTSTLKAAVTPKDTTAGNVTWISSDPETVAVVSGSATDPATGEATVTLEGKKAGTATVTASIGDLIRYCTVTVKQPASGVALNRSTLSLGLHKDGVAASAALTATAEPTDCTDPLEWVSSNESVAVVDQDGVVTAVGAGAATVTVTCGGERATCAVTVTDYQIRALSMDSEATVYLNGNETHPAERTLTLSIEPFDTQDDISWSNGNPDAVTLDTPQYSAGANSKTGTVKITANGTGKAVITATAANGVTARCTVTVIVLAREVTLDRSALTLERGQETTLKATVLPASTNDPSIRWTSDDHTVALVNNGVVTATGVGAATITAEATDGSGKSAACSVTVGAVSAKSLRVTPRRLTLREGDVSETLLTVIEPSAAANTAVVWSSNDNNVATVADGKVTAVGVGEAEICATTVDGGLTDVCYVTVRPKPVEAVSLSPNAIDVFLRDQANLTQALSAIITPDDATDQRVIWTSSNESVASVTDNGDGTATVALLAAGSATITARSSSNSAASAACGVVVRATRVTGVSLNKASLELNPLEDEQLTATLTSDSAGFDPDNTDVAWNSSNTSVATVDTDGTVHAVAAGTAVITVRTADQGFVAACVVRVWNKATGVTLNETELNIDLSSELRTAALTAAIEPGDTTDSAQWTVADNRIAQLSAPAVANGSSTVTVYGLKAGTTTVTVKVGNLTRTCAVTVTNPVTGIALDTNALTLTKDGTHTFTVTRYPANADSAEVTWTSSNSAVVSVASSGEITANAVGSATVTAFVNGHTATCAVTVKPILVSSITMAAALSLAADGSERLTPVILPANATNPALNWSSSDSTVATVAADGTVHALKAGTVIVTADADDDSGRSAICIVTVAAPTGVTGVSITDAASPITLTMDSTLTLHASVAPAEAANRAVAWSSSNPAVAAVSASGVVTPIAPGIASIEVRTDDGGYSDSRTVTVVRLASGIAVDPASVSLPVGGTAALSATLLGEPTNPNVNWSVSGNAVSVSDSGVVTALAAGSATVTAAAADQVGLSRTCVVTVYEPVTAVAIHKDGTAVTSLALNRVTAPTAQLAAVTTGGSDALIDWSSSDNSVVTVDDSGLLSAAGAGFATITVTATTGDVTVSKRCNVTVSKAVLSADTTSMTLVPTNDGAATVTFTPWTAGMALTWTVPDSGVVLTEGALVGNSKSFTISSLGNGVCTVLWTKAEDTRYEASEGRITVSSVYHPITAVSIDRGRLETGCALTASVDQANRVVRVAGYVSESAETYSLAGKLNFTTASGVVSGLSAVYDAAAGTVAARLNGSAICTYALDRSGIVSLPATVSVATTVIAEENTAVSTVSLTNANISGVEAAVAAAAAVTSVEIDNATMTVAVNLVPVSQNVGTVAGYQTVTLDIEPWYSITDKESGTELDSGKLEELSSAITIEIKTAFQPALIVHKHGADVEYITPLCSGPDSDGFYTVSWQQSTFSEVELLAEDAARLYLAERANREAAGYDYELDGSTLRLLPLSGAAPVILLLARYENGRMRALRTVTVSQEVRLDLDAGYWKIFRVSSLSEMVPAGKVTELTVPSAGQGLGSD